MPVQIFTKSDFEKALPINKKTHKAMCAALGLIDGEHAYLMPVKPEVFIMVRSSVRASGYSAESGKDSIRAWLVDESCRPLGSKVQAHVKRLPGWSGRLVKVLRELYRRGLKLDHCPECNQMMGIYKVKKKGPNKGKLFTNCRDHGHFTWVD